MGQKDTSGTSLVYEMYDQLNEVEDKIDECRTPQHPPTTRRRLGAPIDVLRRKLKTLKTEIQRLDLTATQKGQLLTREEHDAREAKLKEIDARILDYYCQLPDIEDDDGIETLCEKRWDELEDLKATIEKHNEKHGFVDGERVDP